MVTKGGYLLFLPLYPVRASDPVHPDFFCSCCSIFGNLCYFFCSCFSILFAQAILFILTFFCSCRSIFGYLWQSVLYLLFLFFYPVRASDPVHPDFFCSCRSI